VRGARPNDHHTVTDAVRASCAESAQNKADRRELGQIKHRQFWSRIVMFKD
jgi:hypothetical protein